MPDLSGLASAAAVALLLALTGCAREATPENLTTAAPGPSRGPAPAMTAPTVAAPPMAAPEPEGSGPHNSFIICPGNPRCPSTGGSQPKSGQDY